jgi:uncharacterized protein YecT (DUF1311 family)
MKTALLGVCLALVSVTAAQAIDCANADSEMDQIVCGSPDLLEADSALNAAYQAALKAVGPKMAKVLKADQKDWLDLAGNCIDGSTDGSIDPAAATSCLTDYFNKRIAYLTGAPAEGPDGPDPLLPVVIAGLDGTFEHLLRFAKPATPGEEAFNAQVDAAFAEIFVASKDGETSDYFDMTLVYASPELISVNIDKYLDGERYIHPMPSNVSINIDMQTGKVLEMADMLDAAGLEAIKAACAAQTTDYVGDGEGADIRRQNIDFMVEDLPHWSFRATGATLIYLDYDTQDSPPKCTIGYNVLKPLMKPSFPLPR